MKDVSTVGVHPGRRRWKRPARRDWLTTAVVGALTVPPAFLPQGDGKVTDALGWALVAAMVLLTAWRRLYPLGVLLVLVPLQLAYHSLGNAPVTPVVASMVILYSLAVAGPRRRTFIVVPALLAVALTMMLTVSVHDGLELIRTSGWVLACSLLGEAVRVHRNYVGAIVERAERAERTREETAARRVAEERLRIARDLHDLLAHSITLIGVRTSVAAHVLNADPERLDRATLSQALEGIADTCREARRELKRTLEVLRAEEDGGPPPGLGSLAGLGRAAESAGATVSLSVSADGEVPPAVGAAAYRIVQQGLTNAVQHGGPEVGIRVSVALDEASAALLVDIVDDGSPADGSPADGAATGRPPGHGLIGMRERARSVGGTVAAGPRADGPGFAVRAVLPCAEAAPRTEVTP
ncbi:sensor histidine kinase [Streptomyces kebangsaanensis]|uniref:histidine kinase n=1 Tax=Streptomyces kebangsaanensis TaxID=864058 RepID=A0ABW6KQP0_9ACTN